MMRRLLAVIVPGLALAAAGCGSSSSNSGSTNSPSSSSAAPAAPSTTAAPAAAVGAITVGETQYKLTPANPSVKSGNITITAKNNGTITHALTVVGGGPGGKDARSADIAPGHSATLAVVLKPGKSYQWYCPIDGHRSLGMTGQIKVSGSGTATPSAAPNTTTSSPSGSSTGSSSGGSSSGSSGGGGYGY